MEGGGIKRLMQVVTMVGAGVSVAVVKSRMVVLVVSHEMGVEEGGGGAAEVDERHEASSENIPHVPHVWFWFFRGS